MRLPPDVGGYRTTTRSFQRVRGRAIAARIGAGVAVLATVAGISAATSAAPVTAVENALARVRTAGELR